MERNNVLMTFGQGLAQTPKVPLRSKEPRPKTTLQNIAREAGVSKATVSQVLNGSPKVSHKTSQKVLTLMKQLNYKPNLEARRLALRRWAPKRTDSGFLPPENSFRLA